MWLVLYRATRPVERYALSPAFPTQEKAQELFDLARQWSKTARKERESATVYANPYAPPIPPELHHEYARYGNMWKAFRVLEVRRSDGSVDFTPALGYIPGVGHIERSPIRTWSVEDV